MSWSNGLSCGHSLDTPELKTKVFCPQCRLTREVICRASLTSESDAKLGDQRCLYGMVATAKVGQATVSQAYVVASAPDLESVAFDRFFLNDGDALALQDAMKEEAPTPQVYEIAVVVNPKPRSCAPNLEVRAKPQNFTFVQTGKFLFEFESMQDWIDNAARAFKVNHVNSQTTVAIDRLGRLCGWGLHFRIAQNDDAYPVRVYILRSDMEQPGKDAGEDKRNDA